MDYRNTSPVRWCDCVPHGLIGYQDRKAAESARTQRDRHHAELATRIASQQQAFITRLNECFPQLGVLAIAASIVPWNLAIFKERVAQAQLRYLREL